MASWWMINEASTKLPACDGIGWDGLQHQKSKAAMHSRITQRWHAPLSWLIP